MEACNVEEVVAAFAAHLHAIAWLPGRLDDPAARVRTPRLPPSDVTPYQLEESARILAAVAAAGSAVPARVDHAILTTFRYSGLRLVELLDLTLRDVDLDQRRLTVVGKGGRQRAIPLAHALRRELERYVTTVRPDCPPSPWLFSSPRSRADGPWWGSVCPSAVRRAVREHGEAADVAGRHHQHRWRHTFATDVLRADVDVHPPNAYSATSKPAPPPATSTSSTTSCAPPSTGSTGRHRLPPPVGSLPSSSRSVDRRGVLL